MPRFKIATLVKYESITTGDIYYGYNTKDAVKKEIDGSMYIEVTNSLTKPKISFIRLDNLRRIGEVTFEVK